MLILQVYLEVSCYVVLRHTCIETAMVTVKLANPQVLSRSIAEGLGTCILNEHTNRVLCVLKFANYFPKERTIFGNIK